jgi:hypothetical protein
MYQFHFMSVGNVCCHNVITSVIHYQSLPLAEANITKPFDHHLTKSSQGFQDVPLSQSKKDVVGRPIPHLSAAKQASGTAVYVDDMPKFKNELYCGVVWSTRSHAKVVQADASEAVKIPGVWGFIGAKDLEEGEHNTYDITGVMDEVVFAEEVNTRGQIVGVVLADNQMTAQLAAKRVKVTYEELPSILSIQEAIEAESFYNIQREVKMGSVEKGFAHSDHIVTGELHIGGQEHFYLETNAILVVPKEDGEMEVFHSTQNANVTQLKIAQVTGIPSSKIVVRVKRLGGGFGGKETRTTPLACAVAIAAKRLGEADERFTLQSIISTCYDHPFPLPSPTCALVLLTIPSLYSSPPHSQPQHCTPPLPTLTTIHPTQPLSSTPRRPLTTPLLTTPLVPHFALLSCCSPLVADVVVQFV